MMRIQSHDDEDAREDETFSLDVPPTQFPSFRPTQESPGGELSSPLTPVTPPMENINGTDEICDTTPNSDALPGPAQNALAFAHR